MVYQTRDYLIKKRTRDYLIKKIKEWYGDIDQFVNPDTNCIEMPEAESMALLKDLREASKL